MLHSVEGVYRDGKVELSEKPPGQDESRVIVTFLEPDGRVDLKSRQIDEAQAADLRGRLQAFHQDWDAPEMDVYDAP